MMTPVVVVMMRTMLTRMTRRMRTIMMMGIAEMVRVVVMVMMMTITIIRVMVVVRLNTTTKCNPIPQESPLLPPPLSHFFFW